MHSSLIQGSSLFSSPFCVNPFYTDATPSPPPLQRYSGMGPNSFYGDIMIKTIFQLGSALAHVNEALDSDLHVAFLVSNGKIVVPR